MKRLLGLERTVPSAGSRVVIQLGSANCLAMRILHKSVWSVSLLDASAELLDYVDVQADLTLQCTHTLIGSDVLLPILHLEKQHSSLNNVYDWF